jgi:predicted nucleotidyltransferase
MLSISDIKNKLAQICNGTKVKKIVLFGSYAKGTSTPDSDIDLYLVSNGAITGFDFFDLKAKIEDEFKIEIDLIPDLDIVPNSPIEQHINEHGMVVYERQR